MQNCTKLLLKIEKWFFVQLKYNNNNKDMCLIKQNSSVYKSTCCGFRTSVRQMGFSCRCWRWLYLRISEMSTGVRRMLQVRGSVHKNRKGKSAASRKRPKSSALDLIRRRTKPMETKRKEKKRRDGNGLVGAVRKI